MPFAMFFDWQHRWAHSGLAIHGTDEQGVKTLGERGVAWLHSFVAGTRRRCSS